MGELTEFYGKDCLDSISMELYDLEKTGSYDERENMVCVVRLPRDIGVSVRRAYRSLDPSGIKDFKMIEINSAEDEDREMCELYFGSHMVQVNC